MNQRRNACNRYKQHQRVPPSSQSSRRHHTKPRHCSPSVMLCHGIAPQLHHAEKRAAYASMSSHSSAPTHLLGSVRTLTQFGRRLCAIHAPTMGWQQVGRRQLRLLYSIYAAVPSVLAKRWWRGIQPSPLQSLQREGRKEGDASRSDAMMSASFDPIEQRRNARLYMGYAQFPTNYITLSWHCRVLIG